MTTAKKTAKKKLSVKDLSNLKAGAASGGTEASSEASDGKKTLKILNQKQTNAMAALTASGAIGPARG